LLFWSSEEIELVCGFLTLEIAKRDFLRAGNN
jgi:hypothetical protein